MRNWQKRAKSRMKRKISNWGIERGEQRIVRKQIIWLVLLLALGLAACGGAPAAQPDPAAMPADATLQPTPTLAPGVPTIIYPTPTPAGAATAGVAQPAATAVPTLTPLPSPTPLPNPAERLALGRRAIHNGDFAAAITHLESLIAQPEALPPADQGEAAYLLGIAYQQEGRHAAAANIFRQLAAAGNVPAAYWLGRALFDQGNYAEAVTAYQQYLASNLEMAAYVSPAIAQAYLALGDTANAQAAYETAVAAPAHRLTQIDNRLALADLYRAAGNLEGAIAQYDAVRDLAVTELTKGKMTYLAGATALEMGDTEEGYGRFLEGVANYPRAAESYQGLIQLVEADVPVDDFQRGLVDFYASAYDPAIFAWQNYIANNPEAHREDVHLYLAWSYEALGDTAAALAQLTEYAAVEPAPAAIERAKMLARAGDTPGAIAQYQAYLADFPDGADAPFAAWQAAVLAERAGDTAAAIQSYQILADAYPWHKDAPEALFHAGWLAYRSGDTGMAVSLWQRAAETYPTAFYGSAAQVWLMRLLPEYQTETEGVPDLAAIQTLALDNTAVNYYALRARDLAGGVPYFTADFPFALPTPAEEAAAQAEAETWLRNWLELPPETDTRTLSSELAQNPYLVRGEKLWQIGEPELAKRELETVRQAVKDDPLASYQLALYFRDLGLYSASILAAERLLTLSGTSAFDAPAFIGRLVYPVYYADLVVPLAEQYDFDPRLQFALLRQESLFESFARSGAAAQGLSQVIPDTGAYIARRLNWPDYENEDLYKPYVGLNFGAYYLNQQLDAFDEQAYAALAAYNAGPGNAARWYEAAGPDLDLFVETVDFAETRLYIERIYTGYAIYRALYE